MAEHCIHIAGVRGSNPLPPKIELIFIHTPTNPPAGGGLFYVKIKL